MDEILFLAGSFTEFKGEDCKRGGDLGLVIALKFGYCPEIWLCNKLGRYKA
ncbi:hypothetical protein ACCC92_07990 [Mucilaginibacter sp. Mucisp84]|uniref:hypothetical protein n=1 Tax=Mucilaginibacter sp. Mucisp84 TaxID=3243058 RepID=UPI0039A5FC08